MIYLELRVKIVVESVIYYLLRRGVYGFTTFIHSMNADVFILLIRLLLHFYKTGVLGFYFHPEYLPTSISPQPLEMGAGSHWNFNVAILVEDDAFHSPLFLRIKKFTSFHEKLIFENVSIHSFISNTSTSPFRGGLHHGFRVLG